MNKNVRIAKELAKIAKSLIAGSSEGMFEDVNITTGSNQGMFEDVKIETASKRTAATKINLDITRFDQAWEKLFNNKFRGNAIAKSVKWQENGTFYINANHDNNEVSGEIYPGVKIEADIYIDSQGGKISFSAKITDDKEGWFSKLLGSNKFEKTIDFSKEWKEMIKNAVNKADGNFSLWESDYSYDEYKMSDNKKEKFLKARQMVENELTNKINSLFKDTNSKMYNWIYGKLNSMRSTN